ncbi:C-C chemokine receptor type 3 [Tenrec ecaudatus]|uniref:C-C chemokine receptor type 3 n=1 Tax=Tenrec ecaudatus TaxID=94439 RepID=UPI003F59722F
MAVSVDEVNTEVEAIWTTPDEYGDEGQPCEKINIQALHAQILPPLYSLLFIAGLLGNVVVVVILTKYRRLNVMTNIYLLNLAVSDLLFVATLPFWIHSASWGKWGFGHSLCKLITGLYYLSLYSEVFFIILLTIDRYLAIVHAVFALRTRTVTFGIITSIFTWALAGLAALPDLIFHEVQMDGEGFICGPHYPENEEDTWKRFHALRMNILGLGLPLLVMAICYSGIIRALLKCPSRQKHKAMRLIVVIMVVFFLFWTPHSLVLLLSEFQVILPENNCEQSRQLDLALEVTRVVAHSHCCINPIIYAFVGERFQKYLHHFFYRHVGKYLPFLPREKLERASSVSPSTGEQKLLSGVF